MGEAPEKIIETHRACMEIESRLAQLLKPGAVPSDIYKTVMNELGRILKQNFYGFGSRQVKFLGHGIDCTLMNRR